MHNEASTAPCTKIVMCCIDSIVYDCIVYIFKRFITVKNYQQKQGIFNRSLCRVH